MVSPRIWNLILLNPISHVIITFRDVFDGTFHPLSWVIFATGMLISLGLGAFVITRARVAINEYI